jgi:hypothetical protein
MRRRDLLTALATTPVVLAFPFSARASEEPEADVARSCSGDFTVVQTGKDKQGRFVFSLQCDGCGSVSPPAFSGEHFQDCIAWRVQHDGGRIAELLSEMGV